MVESYTIGVDLGGTKVEVALVDAKGKILSSHKYPTHAKKGPDKVISEIISCINDCLGKAKKEAKALGIGVAGQLDLTGNILFSPNLKWRNIPLKKKLEKSLGLPVVVTNDVRAATIGEWRYGSGRGSEDLIVIFVGTGIGGGVVSGGRLLIGCSNTGGELGHITIVTGGRKCHCPNSGCLEAYAGGWAIAERAQIAVKVDPERGKNLISAAGKIEKITSATVNQVYQKGDPLAKMLIDETCQYLAAGAIGIVNAFNPCLFVMGGGVIEGLPQLVQRVEKITKKRALSAAVRKLKFVKASLGSKAGIVGAAILAQDLNKIKS